ncbi:MAG: hypothetical protein RIC19_10995 [Phaeodactylibacter sp.]|uniref:hypothetical protein n=1 Tax=Phaeodactylibacter sp. TaxID=1940289 RepID=UPI0032EDCA48
MQTNIKHLPYSGLAQRLVLLPLFFLASLSLTAQEAYAFDDIWPAAKKGLDNKHANTVILWDWYGRNDYPVAYIKVAPGAKKEIPNLNNLKPAIGDKAHGMYVPKGYYVELYQSKGYQGKKYVFTEGLYVNLWHAKDMASSIKIIPMPNYNPDKGLENCAYFYGSKDNKESAYQSYEGLRYGEYSSAQELSAADSYNYLFVKGDVRVYVWGGVNFSGANNFDRGTVFYDKHEGRGTLWNLKDYGFGENISSVRVMETKWGLKEVLIEEVEARNDGQSESRRRSLGSKTVTEGTTDGLITAESNVSYTASVTETVSNSTTLGLSVTNSFETAANYLITDVTWTVEIEAMVQNTITTGKATEETITTAVKASAAVPKPHNCTIVIEILGIPQTKYYRVTKTFVKIDSITAAGKLVPVLFDGKPKEEVVESTLIIEDFYDFSIQTNYLAGDPDCPHVASVAQSGGKTTSNNSNASDAAAVKEVLFHSQNSLSLAEAQAMAKQNGWEMASSSEVEAAFQQKALNVWAYGRMADGRFAVPVQQDQSNFKKGPNIGVTGGNQGFFYTISDISAPTNTGDDSRVEAATEDKHQGEADHDDSSNTGVTVVTCVDNNGTLVGYFLDLKDGTSSWIETDTEGETKFTYEEIKKEDSAIHLYDTSRKVAICLELNRQEVLYSDANTTSPFSIYTISEAH